VPQRDVVAFSVNDRALGLVALIGEAAKGTQLHLQLMNTCRRDQAELSVMMLAKRVIDYPNCCEYSTSPGLVGTHCEVR
jgi:hypothetical protein